MQSVPRRVKPPEASADLTGTEIFLILEMKNNKYKDIAIIPFHPGGCYMQQDFDLCPLAWLTKYYPTFDCFLKLYNDSFACLPNILHVPLFRPTF